MVGVEPLPIKAGSPTLPAPGYDLRIFDEDGVALGANTEGAIVIKGAIAARSICDDLG